MCLFRRCRNLGADFRDGFVHRGRIQLFVRLVDGV